MSLELTLQNALSGLQTSQSALQTISNNIANANTEGYSRKIADPSSRVIDGKGFGVEVGTIRRSVDEGILRLLRSETGTMKQLQEREKTLSQLNQFFGRPEDNNSITHLIAELGSKFEALSISPSIDAAQFTAVTSGEDILRSLKQMSDEVQRLRNEANTAISNSVQEFNTHITAVANLNAQIIEFTNSKLNATELQDQRDSQLNSLSNMIDIKYFEAGDGSLNVFASSGQTIVSGGSAQTLTFQAPSLIDAKSEYTPTSATNYIGPGNSGHPVGSIPGIFVGDIEPATDITRRISSGKLKGLIDLRDFELPTLQSQLDELAEKLKSEINVIHNKGTGNPAAYGLTGDRYVSTDMILDATGHVRVGILNDAGVLQEDKIFDLSLPEGFSAYESEIFASATSDVITTAGQLTFWNSSGTAISTVNYTNSNTLTELRNLINGDGTLSGQGITASLLTDGTNLNRLKITDSGGETFSITESSGSSGTFLSDLTPKVRTVGDLVTGLSTMTNLTASINSSGRLQLVTSNNLRVGINELTSSMNAANDQNKGFSDFFGLNRFINSSENFSIYRSNLFASSGTDAITTAGTLQFTGNDGTAWNTTVVYTASDTLSTLVDKINADSTLNTEGVSARVVVDGGTLDQFRLEITDSNSDEFSVVETSGGSFLSDTGLKTDTRGLSNRMTIRSDIKENNSFISRGTLQSNTFQSRSLNSKTANFAGTTPTVSAGALTFKIDSSTSVTKTYATTDSLDDVVTAINTDTNLIAANITAEVIIEGSNFKLKVRDNNGDDFMVVDSGGLSLDVSQGISLGDNSVADRMSEIFTTSVAFNAVPAKGARGGLPNSSNTFGEYSAKILSGNSAEALTVQNKLTFQESLQQELSSKNASISGVNMDQELSNLIIFEQAYMAAARIITTTQELFRVLREMV